MAPNVISGYTQNEFIRQNVRNRQMFPDFNFRLLNNWVNPNIVIGPNQINFNGHMVKFKHALHYIENNTSIGKNTASEYCFVISFLNAQCRCFQFQENTVTCIENQTISIDIPAEARQIFPENHPFLSHDRSSLVLFNNVCLQPDLDTDTIKIAKLFHRMVESATHEMIEVTTWDRCFEVYASFFQVHIHVYFDEKRGRQKVFIPQQWNEEESYHIYFYLKDKHFYPLINIRKFFHVQRVLGLCDYCQHVMDSNETFCKKHIGKCHGTRNYTSRTLRDFIYKMMTPIQRNGKNHFNQFMIPYLEKDKVQNFCEICETFDCTEENHVWVRSNVSVVKCKICSTFLPEKYQSIEHVCYMKPQKIKDYIPDSRLFVLDIESMQQELEPEIWVHQCILLCVQNMYDDTKKKEYTDEKNFITDFMEDPFFENATFIAHNGGGYDYQFLIRVLDIEGISYEIIPRPSSHHKYLSVNVQSKKNGTLRFIDFRSLVPGSLQSIAQSFGLPVLKGDFPLRLLTPENQQYRGPLPPYDSPQDYFCRDTKRYDENEEREFLEWYEEEKMKYFPYTSIFWDAQEHLRIYCWQDVTVLALACKKYREKIIHLGEDALLESGWKCPVGIDPFTCLTMSQVAMTIYLHGVQNERKIYITQSKERWDISWKQFLWLEQESQRIGKAIIHAGNSCREYYIPIFGGFLCDGFCPQTRTVYEFLVCAKDGCKRCFPNHRDVKRKDCFNMSYDELFTLKTSYLQKLHNLPNPYQIEFIWECEYTRDHIPAEQEAELRAKGEIIVDREFFFGGRTEVFSSFADCRVINANQTEQMEILYHDVTSLYPYICAFKPIPFGKPIYLYGNQIDKEKFLRKEYFGFAKIKIHCNPYDYIGLLPAKDEKGRLVFSLSPEKIGCWSTEEIYLALENGYQLLEIYQLIVFEESDYTDDLFRGYISTFLRMKQESEGWKKCGYTGQGTPTNEEMETIIETLYQSNGNIGRMRKEKVMEDKASRHINKMNMNCVWGKFCQRQATENTCEITNELDFHQLCYFSGLDHDKMQFRNVYGTKWIVHYEKEQDQIDPNNRINIFLSSMVTAHARCILHRQMLKIGPERVLYCDTDSIIFLYPIGAPRLEGTGLGKWVSETSSKISIFLAVAPKCYYVLTENEETILKSKGATLTKKNKSALNEKMLITIILNTIHFVNTQKSILLDNFTIYPNVSNTNLPYATMLSRYSTKQIQGNYTKRKISLLKIANHHQIETVPIEEHSRFSLEEIPVEKIVRIQLYPFGYGVIN